MHLLSWSAYYCEFMVAKTHANTTITPKTIIANICIYSMYVCMYVDITVLIMCHSLLRKFSETSSSYDQYVIPQ